jgi:hypothetical protein
VERLDTAKMSITRTALAVAADNKLASGSIISASTKKQGTLPVLCDVKEASSLTVTEIHSPSALVSTIPISMEPMDPWEWMHADHRMLWRHGALETSRAPLSSTTICI